MTTLHLQQIPSAALLGRLCWGKHTWRVNKHSLFLVKHCIITTPFLTVLTWVSTSTPGDKNCCKFHPKPLGAAKGDAWEGTEPWGAEQGWEGQQSPAGTGIQVRDGAGMGECPAGPGSPSQPLLGASRPNALKDLNTR